MWRNSPRTRGFSLIEVLVAMGAVVVILSLATTLTVSSRRLAQRQQLQVDARQTGRAALDYVIFCLRGASDINIAGANSGALLVWLEGAGGDDALACPDDSVCFQTSFNNVDDPSLADTGTDIITVSRPSTMMTVEPVTWPGYNSAATVDWAFDFGCPSDAQNMQLFKDFSGAHTTGTEEVSRELFVADQRGDWRLFQVTGYTESQCGQAQPFIRVASNAGATYGLNPPGGHPDLVNPRLVLGVEFMSLRVCNGWLEQKNGIFQAAADNNCPELLGPDYTEKPDWTPLLANVEDFQVAYIFRNGEIWNNSPSHRLALTGAVPGQGVPANTYDATNVVGFRVTVTVRAPVAPPEELGNPRYFRPEAEDNPAASTRDGFQRFQTSAVAVLRNRNPRG
jgi:prepilin-type N-terminal cleavage/methylation domain-containing protein